MKKLSRKIGIIIVVVLAIVLVVSQTWKRQQIEIGVILPLTGGGAVYGREIQEGIDLAIDEINKEAGIKENKVRAIYEDDQGSPSVATSAFQKIISQDRIQVVIGGAFSSPALAIAPIAQKEKVVLISPTASSPKLTFSGDFIFRIWPSDNLEASKMAEYASRSLKQKRIAILYSNSEYGLGLKEIFAKTFHELNGEIVCEEAFSEGDTDFRTQILKIKTCNPEAVYMVGYYKEFSEVLKQRMELGLKSQFLSCVTFNEPELLRIAGNAAEGVIFTQPFYDPSSGDPQVKLFVDKFKQRYGKIPGIYAAHGYDAMKVVALSIERGGIKGLEIQKAMSTVKDIHGVSGPITFDENGDVIKPARLYIVKDEKFIPMEE